MGKHFLWACKQAFYEIGLFLGALLILILWIGGNVSDLTSLFLPH